MAAGVACPIRMRHGGTYAVVVVHGALAIGPERVEEAIVGALSGGRRACSEVALFCSLSLEDEVQGRCQGCGSATESEKKG